VFAPDVESANMNLEARSIADRVRIYLSQGILVKHDDRTFSVSPEAIERYSLSSNAETAPPAEGDAA
jgi:hypothetical protein